MYCAYTIPGMGGNSLMYYYNGKAVSGKASGGVSVRPSVRGAAGLRSGLCGDSLWGRDGCGLRS